MGRQAEETGRKNASVEFHPAQFRTSGYGEAPSGRPGARGRAIDQRDQAIGVGAVLSPEVSLDRSNRGGD